MKTILSKDAPAAIGPYSQAVLHKETLYISGQLGLKAGADKLEETLHDRYPGSRKPGNNQQYVRCKLQRACYKAYRLFNIPVRFYNCKQCNGQLFSKSQAGPRNCRGVHCKNALIEIDAIVACKD